MKAYRMKMTGEEVSESESQLIIPVKAVASATKTGCKGLGWVLLGVLLLLLLLLTLAFALPVLLVPTPFQIPQLALILRRFPHWTWKRSLAVEWSMLREIMVC